MKLSSLKQQIEELDGSYFPRESKREKDKLLITHGSELLRRLLVAEEALSGFLSTIEETTYVWRTSPESERMKSALKTIRGEEE